ncbi:MAG TPA: VCBS domain-containing protein, partial [Burkholderiales bacterium]|nr:VCBS domain-containing protein [Burkholderiales bacterium]
TNGMTYNVTVAGGTATVTLSKAAGVSAANAQTLVNGIAYQNTNTDVPTAGNRVFSLTEIRDTGGTANGGTDTTALAGISSTVNVVAVNDAAVLSSATVGLTETNAALSTSGTLTISDVDSAQTFVAQTNTAGTYGTFSIDAAGAWSWTANSALNNLAAGQTVSDTFTVASADGTTTTVQVSVTGTNDAAVLSSSTILLTKNDAPLSASGQLAVSDVDSPQSFVPQTNVSGTYGTFSIDAAGAWTFTGNAAVDALTAGQTVSETFTVVSADGTASTVSVSITRAARDSVVISTASGPTSSTPVVAPDTPQPAPVVGDVPTPGLAGALPLKLPVDVTVPAANVTGGMGGAGATAGAFTAPGMPDLNALPPTAAGPAEGELSGFPVARLSVLEAAKQLETSLTPAAAAEPRFFGDTHRLFVYQGIPNMRLFGDGAGSVRVPEDAFAHTDPAAVVHLDARLANGQPLPAWLRFEGLRGTFSGQPPQGLEGTLHIEVVARDTDGREARTQFVLQVEELRAESGDRPLAGDLELGLDVDKQEAEKQRAAQRQPAQPREAAKPVKQPGEAKPQAAMPFSEQMKAAKETRDPLLERIAKAFSNTFRTPR